MTKRRQKPTLRLTITAALALMTGLTAAAIAGLSYRSARRNLLDTYRIVLAQVAERIGERAKSYLGPLKNTAAACARLVEAGAVRVERLEDVEALFFAHMAEYHRIASLDFGDAEGNFVMVKRMPDDSLTTKTLHRRGDQVRSEWKSRRPGATLAETSGVRLEPDDAYDPRVRPWFVGARGAPGVHWTDVYALATDRKPAISASIAVQGAGGRTAVMSASMTLDEIDRFLSSIQIGRRGKAFVVDSAGRLLGHPAGVPLRDAADGSLSLPPLSACGDAALEALARAVEFRDALRAGEATELFRFEVEGEAYLATLVPLAYTLGRGWFVGAVVSEDDLLGPVRTELVRSLALSGGVSVCVGSADRLSYTIVGDGVNLAARLEGVNKQYATQILISGETHERIAGRIECRLIDRIAVKGRSRATTLYEPLGEVGRVDPGRLARARIYERGIEAYVGRRFEAALELFDQVLAEEPTDGAAVALRRRAAAFREHPPEPDWNGVFALSEK